MRSSLRHLVYRAKYRFGRSLPLRVPVDVSLELASQCNMKCTYCYHADQARLPFQKGVMEYGIAARILHQAADLRVPAVKLNWKGEATINPHFRDICVLAKELAEMCPGAFIDRLTNSNFKFGSAKQADVIEGLLCQTKVKVSYDSFRKQVFETQRAGGDHELTTRNIDAFYNALQKRPEGSGRTELVIQAVRTKLNYDEDIAAEAERRWPGSKVSIRDMVGGRVQSDAADNLEARRRDPSERQACLQASVRVIFNYEGRAFPCCPDIGEKLCIGDIRRQSVKEIFNGHPARNLRAELRSGDAFRKAPCQGCSSFETFKGFKPAWNS